MSLLEVQPFQDTYSSLTYHMRHRYTKYHRIRTVRTITRQGLRNRVNTNGHVIKRTITLNARSRHRLISVHQVFNEHIRATYRFIRQGQAVLRYRNRNNRTRQLRLISTLRQPMVLIFNTIIIRPNSANPQGLRCNTRQRTNNTSMRQVATKKYSRRNVRVRHNHQARRYTRVNIIRSIFRCYRTTNTLTSLNCKKRQPTSRHT